jgi:5-formyltetrahydrofolate cyclo-ligase
MIVDELPEAPHDFRLDLIVTSDDAIGCDHGRRAQPRSILASQLTPERRSVIPILCELGFRSDELELAPPTAC